MTLGQLFRNIPGHSIFGDAQRVISGLQYDSRRVAPGEIFFAIPGFRQDGQQFISDALQRGAIAIISETAREIGAATWIQVPNIRHALAVASSEFYGYPSRDLELVAVTGTNGKTTTAFLVASILNAAGRKPALFGTIEYRSVFGDPAAKTSAPNTTPESLDLQRMLREAADSGGRAAVMEVSSHSLQVERL